MVKKILFLILTVCVFAFGQVTSDEALAKLKEGNKRYLSATPKQKDFKPQREEQKKGQHPYAIILTCSDSRVPPELIFDEDLGQIFIIRVAGNVIDEVTLGSIEYGAEHLHVPLLVVLGHSACGAVKATLEGGDFGKNINALAGKIKPAVDKAKSKSKDKNLQFSLAIEENVELQTSKCLQESSIITELVHEKKLKIACGIYNIESGEVNFFEPAAEASGSHHEKEAEPGNKKGHLGKAGQDKEPAGEKSQMAESQMTGSADYDLKADVKVSDNIFSDGKKYCAQLSSWQNKVKAEKELRKIKAKYPNAFIMEFTSADHRVWYRVRVGSFSTVEETKKYLASL
ncbi:MAG: SPOR domain-containing protein [Ignavibacteria bacterium]|nr:SPOR domain-containing protein [Ignavibacteria bacterium]